MKVEMGFFKCIESMARDMRHPYIPSTTVLGDICLCTLVQMCCFSGTVPLCEISVVEVSSLCIITVCGSTRLTEVRNATPDCLIVVRVHLSPISGGSVLHRQDVL